MLGGSLSPCLSFPESCPWAVSYESLHVPSIFFLALQGLQIIDMQMSDYLRVLENAIQFGYPVLLQNVQEYLDPTLNPVLNKSVARIGQGPDLLCGWTVGQGPAK